MGAMFFTAALISVLISALILYSLFSNGWEFFRDVEWSRVFANDAWNPRQNRLSISTLLVGSLIVTGVAMVVAAPLGLGAAVYLSEYARPRVRSMLKPIIEVLAGIPSVVARRVRPQLDRPRGGRHLLRERTHDSGSMLAAGIGVGILTIPLMASVSEDAMRAVPNAPAPGVRRPGRPPHATTTVRVVVPAAVSGIVAAFILAASRAIGETMVVFIAGGAADSANFTTNPLDGSLTMTAAMASLATGTENVRGASLAVPSLYFVGIVLFFITLTPEPDRQPLRAPRAPGLLTGTASPWL